MKKLHLTLLLVAMLGLGACLSRERVAQEASNYLAYMEVIAKHAEQSIQPLRVAYDQAIAMGADEEKIAFLKDLIDEAEAKLPTIRQELANAQQMAAEAAVSKDRWAFVSAIISGILGSGLVRGLLGPKLAALSSVVAGVQSFRTKSGLDSEETLALDAALNSKMDSKIETTIRGIKKRQHLV